MPVFTPYRIDIQQGNVVTQDMMSRVEPGMTEGQVRFALGTPLIVDPFHKDRWDYVYQYQKAGVVTEQRRIVVLFKDGRLDRIEGDVVAGGAGRAQQGGAAVQKPAAAEPVAPGSVPETASTAPAAGAEVPATRPASAAAEGAAESRGRP